MFTIDASVHVNALNTTEPDSASSQDFLEHVHHHALLISSPTLLLVEVAAAVSRAFNDATHGVAIAHAIRLLPRQSWIPLNESLAQEASQLAAQYRLRGADAVYAAVAQREQTMLITLDRQQRERLSPLLTVLSPSEALERLRSSKSPMPRKG